MCCRSNSGQNEPLTKLWNTKAIAPFWRLLLGSVLIMSTAGLPSCNRAGDTNPWFGRGQHLPKAPITVLIGPIDLDRGVAGVLELDMKRKQVETVLGKPLVGAMPSEEALRRGVDPEDVMNNLYGGVFAWVLYTNTDKVASIEFTPRALKERMGLEQRLLVRVGNRTLVFSSQTHRREVESFVQGIRVKRLRDYGHYMVLEFEKSSCSIHFDYNGYFESLSILITA